MKRIGHGEPAKGNSEHIDWSTQTTTCAKRVRVKFGGETITDTTCALLLREPGKTPVYCFPEADVRLEFLTPGVAENGVAYWSLEVEGRRQEDAAWSYRVSNENYFSFLWDRVDQWLEEDEEIFVHPRDPFVRIDILDSDRQVQIVVGGEIVAQSTQAKFLFETGLPVRYYLPRSDVEQGALTPSPKSTACPYKGRAKYWSVHFGGKDWPNVVWSYEEPLPECARIKGYLCFFDELVDKVLVDGVIMDKPKMRANWR